VLSSQRRTQVRELVGGIRDDMDRQNNGSRSFVIENGTKNLSVGSLSREKSFKIDADLVRHIFGDLEFDFLVGGVHPNDSQKWVGRCRQDGDFNCLLGLPHRTTPGESPAEDVLTTVR
jgi:hypothetical protein